MPTKHQFLDLATYAISDLTKKAKAHTLATYDGILILNLWDAKDSPDCPINASELFSTVKDEYNNQAPDVVSILMILVSRMDKKAHSVAKVASEPQTEKVVEAKPKGKDAKSV